MAEDHPPSTTGYLSDAAHFPGGHAAGIVFPRTIEEVAAAVREARTVLAIGAQSSLTGGATPMGETILSTSKLTRIVSETADTVTVEAGVTVARMQEHLAARGAWFPPAPTFTGAFAGGIVATNAAGAATFKYGSTREWVVGMTVVLSDGTVLRLWRGKQRAQDRVPVPAYSMPGVRKHSAGYFAAPEMDLVDLFIGSEGTLGIVTDVTFGILSPAPQTALALVRCRAERDAFRVVSDIRSASVETWRTGDRGGIDAAGIENLDARCIAILCEDGAAARNNVDFPADASVALLVQLELPSTTSAESAYREIASAMDENAADTPLNRFCRLLARHDVFEGTEVALPGDRRRFEQLIAIREAVPTGVNQRVARAKASVDSRIVKTAADVIVPFERSEEMNAIYRRGLEARRLDYAIWGHISDGNVHPNVIPRSYDEVESGMEAILEFGREVARLGGCPLAEHGVGRSPIKQALLRQLYGEDGIEQMRAVKRVLDPEWKLAPGVIFPA